MVMSLCWMESWRIWVRERSDSSSRLAASRMLISSNMRVLLLANDGIFQTSNSFDLRYHFVADLHVAQALRRSGQDNVAGRQGHKFAEVGNQRGNVENHVARVAFLRDLAVHQSAKRQIHWVRDIGGIHQPGADGRCRVAALDAKVGAIVIFQVIANRVIVRDSVAGHVIVRIFLRHVASCFSDHNRQLALVMHVRDTARAARLAEVPAQALRAFQKYQRLVGRFEGKLLGMVRVVETEGENSSWLNGRKPDYIFFSDQPLVPGNVMDGAGVGDARVFHSGTTSFSIAARPSISTRTRSPA